MAVPRPLLLAVLGLLLVSATFMATRSSRQQSDRTMHARHQQASKASKAAGRPAAASSTASAHRSSSRAAPARHAHQRTALAKPAAVSRAIARGRVVVLAFFQPGADDRATAAAVGSLSGGRGVAVFTDRVSHVARVDQAPAVVIVDHHRRARLIQGYVDPETLAQEVSDARG
jgi:hypothetical protein